MPKLRAGFSLVTMLISRSFSKAFAIVNPKLISDSEVRITAIKVRSAAMRVRWNAIPVRRDDRSMETALDVGSVATPSIEFHFLSSCAFAFPLG
jgi:hypothetical protein